MIFQRIDMAVQEAEYGTWKSPITASSVSSAGVYLFDLTVDSNIELNDGTVYWIEGRPAEAGRYVVCSCPTGSTDPVSWTPAGLSARTRVHEYGGGALLVYNGAVYFSNMADQRVYRQDKPDGPAEPVTPEGEYFYADGCYAAATAGGRIYYVREDHEVVRSGSRKEAENCLVLVSPSGAQPPQVVASGRDFYSSPRVSADCSKLAWIQWDHPNMPWDATQLCWAALDPATGLPLANAINTVQVPGSGPELNLQYPAWASANRLLYIGDQSGYWNLYSVDTAAGASSNHASLYPAKQDLASPAWMFAQHPHCLERPAGGGTRVLLVSGDSVLRLDAESGSAEPLAQFKVSGYNSIKYPKWSGGYFYAVASSAVSPPAVIRYRLESGSIEVLRLSNSLKFDVGYISVAQPIEFPTANGATAHAYYYPPRNRDFVAPSGSRPPLLVRAHGGPTAAASPSLSLKIQYWTSRGYALADVDYRGSTGYGTVYRNLLRYNWGIADVDDCCAVVRYLANKGLADPRRACIDGGSAGGYTTLACLAFRDTFSAGASHYGVADLQLLRADTHKFESRYLDNLIGRTPEEVSRACVERSPIHHVDKISCPLILFQGDEDRIVPPNQAELMFAKVREKGLPCAYLLFPGEQHGFRKAENINKSLDGQFYFFAKLFGFQPADSGIEVDIVNLPSDK
uniref:Peptidase_S9 domain-containing protein n=2 Tax=Macrostomum lignano TaxID=282301 RepID=A0A1I8HRD0_9PLAT